MEKKYAIQFRINYTYPNGKLVRGSWSNWKKYKKLDGLINAWEYYKTKKFVGVWTNGSGDVDCNIAWQFRPINLID